MSLETDQRPARANHGGPGAGPSTADSAANDQGAGGNG
jgi:hypothetical protein